jgi:hypothetical protein
MRTVMREQQRNLEERHQKFVGAVDKYLTGEKLTRTEEQMIAYGYTAAACGQRLWSGSPKLLIQRNK